MLIICVSLHRKTYIINIINIKHKFMRRINDLQKIADLIKTSFKSGSSKVISLSDGSIDVYAPYLPSSIVSLVSSEIRIGVFPYGNDEVLINIYKI